MEPEQIQRSASRLGAATPSPVATAMARMAALISRGLATFVHPVRSCRGLAAAILMSACVLIPAAASAQTATSALMTGLASGVGKGVASEITTAGMGWGLSSLGLSTDPNAEIVSALNEIENTLLTMSNQLADITQILEQQSCSNAASPLNDALSTIDSLAGRGTSPIPGSYLNLVDRAQADNGTIQQQDLADLFDKVLNGDQQNERLLDVLEQLNNGLIDQGTAQQVISTCGALFPAPTDMWDDRAYYASLHQMLSFYFDYQARAALLVVEAYHYQAIKAWVDAGNDPASIDPNALPQICLDPNATIDVKEACQNATDTYDFVLGNIRAQYGQAGAPYSSGTPDDTSTAMFDWNDADPVVQIYNPGGIVWVKNYDDFARAGGYSSACASANSSAPCGPGVGQYDHMTFEKYGSTSPLNYGANGGYTWSPAVAADWSELTAGWSGNSTSYADHLSSVHGFSGVSTARVFFTGETDTSGPAVQQAQHVPEDGGVENVDVWHFKALEVACFVAMPMTRNNYNAQPFCSGGFDDQIMHVTSDHDNSESPCVSAADTQHDSLMNAGITSPFFEFLYNMRVDSCHSSDHPLGQTFYPNPPGWLLQYESWGVTEDGNGKRVSDSGVVAIASSDYHSQYHWPAFDSAAVTCVTEPATSLTRSHFSLNGNGTVPRLCGADFDKWFEIWIVPPPLTEVAPVLTVPAEPVVGEVQPSFTEPVPHFEVTAFVDFEALVSAVDGSGLPIAVTCDPPFGTELQLGVTDVTCSATGPGGTTVTETFEVHVRYPFELLKPLSETRPYSAKAGSSIRTAFSLGGDRGPDVFSSGGPVSQRVDCFTGEAVGDAEPVHLRTVGRHRKPAHFWRVRAHGKRHRPFSSPYVYEWVTRRSWAGECRQLVLDLVDGTHRAAQVEFKPRKRHDSSRHHDDRHKGNSYARGSHDRRK